MLELLVLCEGQTEREFCNVVLKSYVAKYNVHLAGTLVGKPQNKHGGIRDWEIYRKELIRLASEFPQRHLGVLVDYYAMPDSWPGRTASKSKPVSERGIAVEKLLIHDLNDLLSDRFHPCVQLHEFESLLFVNPEVSALSIAVGGGADDYREIARQLSEIKRSNNGYVEAINDSPETAPSKRLIAMVPGYDKVAWGVTAAKDIPIEELCAGCPWLNRWLNKIQSLNHD